MYNIDEKNQYFMPGMYLLVKLRALTASKLAFNV